jgi:large subunit ribosomal protein L6
MSRVGKKPVIIPNGVTIEHKENNLIVTGPKGTLTMDIPPKAIIAITDGELTVDVAKKEDKKEKALWGLTRALVQNLVDGVTKGFEKKLEVNGVGFKIALTGKTLTLHLGFSHPVDVEVLPGLEVSIEKNVITITGIDKQQVGQFAADVRALKKPEPYKGKGIKYIDEVIIRKAGKVVKAVGK